MSDRNKQLAVVLALDEFTQAYIEAALWSSNDDEGNPLDDWAGFGDVDPETVTDMAKDCAKFQDDARDMLDERGPARGGHDFWLTRNGHGAGFWDGDWPEHGDALTTASEAFGETDLYVTDERTIAHC